MKKQRDEWKAEQPSSDPQRLVFLDETWASTNMTRTHGRCPQVQRLVMDVPHGHWKTTTFVVALQLDGLTAPTVVMEAAILSRWRGHPPHGSADLMELAAEAMLGLAKPTVRRMRTWMRQLRSGVIKKIPRNKP